MATSGNTKVTPDHVIIWCDKNMAVKENNKDSKNVLDTNANLDYSSQEEEDEINQLIFKMDPELNEKKYKKLVKSPLRIFIDEHECLKYINDSIQAKKQPFLITSGQKGALIIPKLADKSSNKLPEKLSGHTFIFCAQRELHEVWAKPYLKEMEIFDDEKGVFAQVLLDIGAYYFEKGQDETANPVDAAQYLTWAYQLTLSATKVDGIERVGHLQYIQGILAELNVPPSDGYDSDVQMSVDSGVY